MSYSQFCVRLGLRFVSLKWFKSVAIPSHPHIYNRTNDALCSRIIHSNFSEGLSCADTSKCYGYPYETIKSIAKAFEGNGQLVPKHRGNVHYPILQDEHFK